MKQLIIDTGIQEFEINGSGVLRFNPSDPNVYNRFFAAETTLTELDAEAQKRMEQIELISRMTTSALARNWPFWPSMTGRLKRY